MENLDCLIQKVVNSELELNEIECSFAEKLDDTCEKSLLLEKDKLDKQYLSIQRKKDILESFSEIDFSKRTQIIGLEMTPDEFRYIGKILNKKGLYLYYRLDEAGHSLVLVVCRESKLWHYTKQPIVISITALITLGLWAVISLGNILGTAFVITLISMVIFVGLMCIIYPLPEKIHMVKKRLFGGFSFDD